ncbi:hypothetical protein B0H11DRAFT_1680961, partial [Mycena galericulata]
PSQPMHPFAPPNQNWMHGVAWSNQLPPQGFHNGTMVLPSFFPRQVLHDAFVFSNPVSTEDEPILVKALASRRLNGETYKEALNQLHGVSGHSASLWKDYYLDNTDRLDLAAAPSQPFRKTTKKPIYKAVYSPDPDTPPPPQPRQQRNLQPAQSSRTKSSGGYRRTINSLTTYLPVYTERLPPPNTELRIPEPPSRSPSPPTEVVPHNRGGNKFTSNDKAFFIKFLLWQLKGDPTLLRHELIDLLAPHHNATSWGSYWSSHHDLPDKILAAMSVENNDEGEPKQRVKLAFRRKRTAPGSESERVEDSEGDGESPE